MTTSIRTKPWVRVDADRHKGVVITDASGESHALGLDDALFAHKSLEQVHDIISQAELIKDRTSRWIGEHQDEINRAFFSLDRDGAIFVVVQRGKQFDPDFQDALSLLDLEMSQMEGLGTLDFRSFALPYCDDDSVASFLDLEAASYILVD